MSDYKGAINVFMFIYYFSANVHGSLKKRAAPLPPSGGVQMPSGSMYGTLPSSHSRTPSDPVGAGYHTLSHTHKRSPSSDSSSGARSVIHIGILKSCFKGLWNFNVLCFR